MSWSEIKKAVNSDLSTPLNLLITNRPKGYKLVLDSAETGTVTYGNTKTFSSSTGGVLYISADSYIRSSISQVSVDGTVINILAFANYNGGGGTGSVSTYVIPYNSNVAIKNNATDSYSGTITYNASNYKYVPIT